MSIQEHALNVHIKEKCNFLFFHHTEKTIKNSVYKATP